MQSEELETAITTMPSKFDRIWTFSSDGTFEKVIEGVQSNDSTVTAFDVTVSVFTCIENTTVEVNAAEALNWPLD